MRPVPMAAPIIRRSDDRRTAFVGVLLAAMLLALAAGDLIWQVARGGGTAWPAIHLALAGAAGTAIASVMPFFTSALAQVAPASRRVRGAAVGLVAVGALAVVAGVSAGFSALAVLGGCAYLGGLGFVAVAVFGPLRTALGSRVGIVPMAYGVALTQVAVGVTLATALVGGWAPVVTDWAALKPAHAWLNIFGFVSLVIAATLLHLGPTVAGTRIRPRRSAKLALVALMAGPPLVAIGSAGGWDTVARVGALIELVGATSLVLHGMAVERDRGRWTTDRGWHRFTSLSLFAAPIWFLVAVVIATGRTLSFGAAPSAWSVPAIGIPFVLGWVAQVLIGSWTHLVPAIGPGDPLVHAAQRRRLGRWGTARVVSWNGGVAVLSVGLLLRLDVIAALGGAILALCLVLALGLLIGAIPRIRGSQTILPGRR